MRLENFIFKTDLTTANAFVLDFFYLLSQGRFEKLARVNYDFIICWIDPRTNDDNAAADYSIVSYSMVDY